MRKRLQVSLVLSNDPRTRPLLWLACSACVVLLSFWTLIYVDLNYIGETDDRVSFIYGAMQPWWDVAMLSGAAAFVGLLLSLGHPRRGSDYCYAAGAVLLFFICLGPYTFRLTRPLLRALGAVP